MYDAAKVPSPKDSSNGVAQPVAAGTEAEGSTAVLQAKTEEAQTGTEDIEELKAEPVLIKKPHREILDHERKRRVELKCMELQEMMEEQGYTEEEIRQKVSTFRQMLMDKEGVITRDGSHTQPGVNHLHYPPAEYAQDQEGNAYEDGEYNHYYHSDNSQSRVKRKSSSSPSPRPKKRKKKKSGRRRSRFSSSSPMHREKKKKSGKKHKRDRSMSGSRKKRRHRSGSPKNKHKYKNKQRKRSPGETPSRCSQHQGSCCSSRSASLSSARSTSRSPSRLNSKHRSDGQKPSGPPLSPGPHSPTTRHNGEFAQRNRNGKAGRLTHSEGVKGIDKLRLLTASSTNTQSSLLKEPKLHSSSSRSQTGPMCTAAGAARGVDGLNAAVGSSMTQTMGRRGRPRAQNKGSHSPTRSSDSAHSQHNHAHRGRHSHHQRKAKSSHSSKRHHRSGRGQAHRSPSASPGCHSHTSGRKNEESRGKGNLRQRSSSWSSGRSSSRSASRDQAPSKAKSPHVRQNNSRERESPNRSDTDSRARRRSRSYSPIRKRRRDSPSFMEARRITSARKRPIPYYRPSPSSSSYDSSPSRSSRSIYSRSRSRSQSRSRSRSWSRSKSRSWSRSRSRSRSHRSYYSNSSDDSPAF